MKSTSKYTSPDSSSPLRGSSELQIVGIAAEEAYLVLEIAFLY
jgi:hypothetical protein